MRAVVVLLVTAVIGMPAAAAAVTPAGLRVNQRS